MRILVVSVVLAMALSGCVVKVLDNRNAKEPSNVTTVFLYVYNDETQLWDRAREETLKAATCEHIRRLSSTQ